LEISALAGCVKVWTSTVITTILSVGMGGVHYYLNRRLLCIKGKGITPWTIDLQEGKNEF